MQNKTFKDVIIIDSSYIYLSLLIKQIVLLVVRHKITLEVGKIYPPMPPVSGKKRFTHRTVSSDLYKPRSPNITRRWLSAVASAARFHHRDQGSIPACPPFISSFSSRKRAYSSRTHRPAHVQVATPLLLFHFLPFTFLFLF